MIEKSALFCLGALGYGCIELAWRGRTHWTMLLAGGLCMLALWALNERLGRWPLLARCAAGALVITGVELAFLDLLPLASLDFGWVLPAAVCGAVGALIPGGRTAAS